MRTDLLTGLALLAALLLLAGITVAMRADSIFIRRRLEGETTALRLWAHSLADASFDGLVIHRQGVVLLMNRALVRLLGVREREFLGQNFAILARAEDSAALRAELEAPGPEPAQFHLLRANKTGITAEIRSQAIDFEGQPATVTAVRDITARLEAELQIARLTDYDALTGLPNRKLFHTTIENAVAGNDRQGAVSLFLTDIRDFKAVNQQIGRAGGDALLQLLTARITTLLAKQDVLARLGGDKFALLLTGEGPPNRAISLGGQMLAACHEPFVIDGKLITLQLCIGLAMAPDHAADADGLMQASEQALAQAERNGGPGLHVFRHEDALPARATAAEAATLRGDLRTALAHGEIKLLFQPAFTLPDLALHGFEASALWQHTAQGRLIPEQFMAIAESAGLAQELGGQLIERACAEAVAAQAPHLSVRLCPSQLRDHNLPARLAAILRKTGLAPNALEIGITEAMLNEHAAAAGILHSLHHAGIGIALEDFGTGAAPLGALCHLPLTRLKIGRRFVQKLGRGQNAGAMVGATLSLAASLRLQVTATGVESEAELEQLRRHGCHVAQGRLLGEPASRAVYRAPAISLAAAE